MAGDYLFRTSAIRRRAETTRNQGPPWPRSRCSTFGKLVPRDRNRCSHRIPPGFRYDRSTCSIVTSGGRSLRKRKVEVLALVERRSDRLRIKFHAPRQSRPCAAGVVLGYPAGRTGYE